LFEGFINSIYCYDKSFCSLPVISRRWPIGSGYSFASGSTPSRNSDAGRRSTLRTSEGDCPLGAMQQKSFIV
jgi:hypothetical protein